VKPVWVEGEGILDVDGRFYPEANVRATIDKMNQICAWLNTLPTETQDILRWEAELRD
jgi:hypothetical protein